MNNKGGALPLKNVSDGLPVPYVDREVPITFGMPLKKIGHNRGRGAGRTEKLLPQIVVDADDRPSDVREVVSARGTYESAGARDQDLLLVYRQFSI